MSSSISKTSLSGENSTKVCTKCGKEQPKGNFRKYAGRSVDGLRPLCKKCQRAYEKTWRSQSKEARKATRQRRARKEKAYREQYNADNRGHLLAMAARGRSERKNLEFDLDQHIPELERRIKTGCEMTGTQFNLRANKPDWNSPSLDRIDPNKGYVIDNIRIICFAMNAALGSWGEAPLRKLMQTWLER